MGYGIRSAGSAVFAVAKSQEAKGVMCTHNFHMLANSPAFSSA